MVTGKEPESVPDYGIAVCWNCGTEFRVGNHTLQILETADLDTPILCRNCALLKKEDILNG